MSAIFIVLGSEIVCKITKINRIIFFLQYIYVLFLEKAQKTPLQQPDY